MAEQKRAVVVGATGLIGKAVSTRLLERGYELTVFSRDPAKAREALPGASDYVAWQPQETGDWERFIDGAYGVINMAGAPFFRKWTPDYEREVRESRILGTRGLVNAMRAAKVKPRVFINGSSVGSYGYDNRTNRDTPLDEESPAGSDSWGQDSLVYEQDAEQAEALGVRVVLVRTGIVLADHDSALQGQIPQFRNYFGGWVRPGTQWCSWIHIDDEAGLILFALENDQVRGLLNATAPEPQRNKEFSQTLGRVLKRPVWLGVPAALLTRFLGPVAVTVTHGRRVVPKKALDLGYQFQYTKSEDALRDLIH
jgi:uncharacterized protein (TIGR01777 family)